MTRIRSIAIAAAVVALAACSQPQRTERRDRDAVTASAGDASTASTPTAPAPSPTGGDQVLAEVPGTQGPIRVVQRGDRRLLLIGDVVHAAVPWTATGPDPAARDPLIALVTGARPSARTALVIGLGSGRTAMELGAAGLQVTAVEVEPAVIELARAHFGYRGTAVAAEGLAYLRDHADSFDVVVMDAFAGTKPPPDLVTPAALNLLRARTASGGLTALRLLGTPADPDLARIVRELGADAHFTHVLGSGVGAEAQNLYVVASDAPLSWKQDGLPLWPVFLDGEAFAAAAAEGAPTEAATRTITVVGYVHALPDGALALDVAHWEMGAVRYLLAGAAAEPLRARLPAGATFPTQGDIGTDGDVRGTLHELLGGGGVKRSDVRFSPIVATVTGTARLVAIIHPDAASSVPTRDGKPPAITDERLPWGGALYQLDVTAIDGVVDVAAGKALEASVRREVAAAAAAAGKSDLARAEAALGRAAAALEAGFGPRASQVNAHRVLARWRDELVAEHDELARGGFHAAAVCDRMHARVERDDPEAAYVPLLRGFLGCAIDGYVKVARTSDDAYGYDAAARLVHLLDLPADLLPRSVVKQVPRLLRELERKHHAQPLYFPPGWVR